MKKLLMWFKKLLGIIAIAIGGCVVFGMIGLIFYGLCNLLFTIDLGMIKELLYLIPAFLFGVAILYCEAMFLEWLRNKIEGN